MRAIKFIFFCSICVVLSASILSCASLAVKKELYVNVTKKTKFILLPTESIENPIDMIQYLSAEFRGQQIFLNTLVKADENAVEMILFNELGASMGEISYRNGEVFFSSSVIPRYLMRSIKPEYIIADFQFCFYDAVMLGKSLEESGLILEITDGNRRILDGNEVIIEINKTENTVKLVNYLHGYSYTLEGDFHGN